MPFPFDPSPAVLWTLTDVEKLASCEIAFVPIGVKATVMRNGKFLYSRIFATGDEATAWAEEERHKMLALGWLGRNNFRPGNDPLNHVSIVMSAGEGHRPSHPPTIRNGV